MRFFVLVAVALFGISSASADDDPPHIADLKSKIKAVEDAIEDVELWAQMRDAAAFIPKQSRCAAYLEMAADYRDELKALNERYADGSDPEYVRRSRTILDGNKLAIAEYRSCFASVARSGYDKIVAARLAPYEPFKKRYDELTGKYGDQDTGALWAELTRELEALKEALQAEEAGKTGFMGTITSTFRTVTIVRDGKERAAEIGDTVLIGDEVITGPRSRTRIELSDYCEALDAGPTVVNIGSESHVALDRFEPRRARDPQCDGGAYFTTLIRGAVRAFTQGFGGRAAFSVRVGTSLAGIRGTEIVVSRDAASGWANVWVDHGDAFLVTPDGGEQSLTPGTVSFLRNDRIVSQRSFTPDEYAERVVATAEKTGMSPSAAMASRASVRVKPYNPPPSLDYEPPTESARRAAASESRRQLEAMLNAYVQRDWPTVLAHLRPDWREGLQNTLNQPDGEREAVDSGRLPARWVIDCVECRSSRECGVLVRIALNGNPDAFTFQHYILEPDPSASAETWLLAKSLRPEKDPYDANVRACLEK